MINLLRTKYDIKVSSNFKSSYKKMYKQGKDVDKLIYVLRKLANGEKLEFKYKDHSLSNNKIYKNCRECHIEPDWLLVYKIDNSELILLLFDTGSHSDLFDK